MASSLDRLKDDSFLTSLGFYYDLTTGRIPMRLLPAELRQFHGRPDLVPASVRNQYESYLKYLPAFNEYRQENGAYSTPVDPLDYHKFNELVDNLQRAEALNRLPKDMPAYQQYAPQDLSGVPKMSKPIAGARAMTEKEVAQHKRQLDFETSGLGKFYEAGSAITMPLDPLTIPMYAFEAGRSIKEGDTENAALNAFGALSTVPGATIGKTIGSKMLGRSQPITHRVLPETKRLKDYNIRNETNWMQKRSQPLIQATGDVTFPYSYGDVRPFETMPK